MDEQLRIPVEIDYDKGLAQVAKFSKEANKQISRIAPGSPAGTVNIKVGVDTAAAIPQLNNLGVTAQRTATQLNKLPQAADQSSFALLSLGRVAQDAPYGFIGIANNLNPLLESFQRLKATTGTTGGALKALGSSLIGPAGLGFALSAVTALISFSQLGFSSWTRGLQDAKVESSALAVSINGAKDSYVKATQLVSMLKNEIQLAKDGFIDKNRVVKEYNDTIGKTTGFVKNLEEAEKAMQANAAAYIQFTLLKAAANIALGKAAEKAFEIQETINNSTRGNTGRNLQITAGFQASQAQEAARLAGKSGKEQAEAYNNAFNEALKQGKAGKQAEQQKQFEQIGDDLMKQAAELAKKFKFNFFDDNKVAKAVKPLEKIRINLGSSFTEIPPEKIQQHIIDPVTDGINKGIIDAAATPTGMQAFASAMTIEIAKKFSALFAELGAKMPEVDFNLAPSTNEKKLQDALDKAKLEVPVYLNPSIRQGASFAEAIKTSLKGLNQQFTALVADFKTSLANAIGEGIGEAATGGGFESLFSGITSAVGTAMQTLGKAMIAYGIGMEKLKLAIKSLNPAVAIAAGIGLVALGAIVKSRASKATPFASGGLVLGRTFAEIGEGIGTNSSNPEVVAPLDKLKGFFASMLNDIAGRGANVGASVNGGGYTVTAPQEVRLYASGNDLVGVMSLTQQKQNRSF